MPIHGGIKVQEEQEEGNANIGPSGQLRSNQRGGDCMAIFRNRAAPPPVQPPPPAPPAPAQCQWNKRLALGPPPGFGGVRQPPQKRHQSGAQPPHRQQAERQYQKPPALTPSQPPPKQYPQPQHMRHQAAQQQPLQKQQYQAQPRQMHYPSAPAPAQPPQMQYHPVPAQAQPPDMQYQLAPAQAQPPLLRARQHDPTPAAPTAHHATSGAPLPVNTSSKPRLRPGTAVKRPASAFKEPSVVCGVCDVRCMTAFHLKQHEKGRKHQNKVGYAAGEMNVWCDVCTVLLLTKRNVQEHYSGKRHRQRALRSGAAHGSNRAT